MMYSPGAMARMAARVASSSGTPRYSEACHLKTMWMRQLTTNVATAAATTAIQSWVSSTMARLLLVLFWCAIIVPRPAAAQSPVCYPLFAMQQPAEKPVEPDRDVDDFEPQEFSGPLEWYW